jgi:hypothetical protein
MKKPILYFVYMTLLYGCTLDSDKPRLVTDISDDPAITGLSYKDILFTDLFKQTNGVVAADVAHSIPLENNKSFWVFGDSYIDRYDPATETVPCLFQVRNAATIVDNTSLNVEAVLLGNGSPPSYFKYGIDNDYWFWPNAGYSKGNDIYVFQNLIHRTGEGNFGFEEVDHLFVAKINTSNLSNIEYIDLGSKDGISFNNAIVSNGDYRYVYGIRNNGFGRDLFVARFPEGSLQSSWEYHSASGWSSNSVEAVKIHDEFTSSFHVVKINEKYVLITTEFSVGCNQGSEIYSYIADTPHGPFTNKKIIWTVNDTLEGNLPFFYQANAHPEFDNGNEELLVTFCINSYGACVQTCVGGRLNPDYYRPRAIRVPYSLMGI